MKDILVTGFVALLFTLIAGGLAVQDRQKRLKDWLAGDGVAFFMVAWLVLGGLFIR